MLASKHLRRVKAAAFSTTMRSPTFPCNVRRMMFSPGYDLKEVGRSLELENILGESHRNSCAFTCHGVALWRKYLVYEASTKPPRQFQDTFVNKKGIDVKAERKLASVIWDGRKGPCSFNYFDTLKCLDDTDGFGESRHAKFRNCSSIFSLFLLFLCASNNEETEGGSEKAFEAGGVSSILRRLKNLFVVSAAKPIEDDGKCISGNKEPPSSRRKQFNFIADVLEIVQDAVVCIEVKDHSTVNWFGMPQNSSNGSGFVVQEDGLILTNAHVVANQQRCSISVKFRDGRCFAGFIEDVDYESDLATVRVKARGLPTLQLGCSAETRMGEWVVAVGSPLNLSNTVTAGIVSSTRKGAELGIHVNDINYIQTDAAITFGNSGGPLINLDGEAIGINSMKVTPGISFAIPIDHAKTFLVKAASRRASGNSKVSRRYMGLSILTLTNEIRREMEMRTGIPVADQGVFVWQVVCGGPAFLAGLQPGDVITKINGRQMSSAAQVHEIIKTDDKLVLEIQRGKNIYTFTVVPETVG